MSRALCLNRYECTHPKLKTTMSKLDELTNGQLQFVEVKDVYVGKEVESVEVESVEVESVEVESVEVIEPVVASSPKIPDSTVEVGLTAISIDDSGDYEDDDVVDDLQLPALKLPTKTSRCSIPSSVSSDEGPSDLPILANGLEKKKNEEEEEEIEKRGTDSGYESDQRKSFSSSTRVVTAADVSTDEPEVGPEAESSGERKEGSRDAGIGDRDAEPGKGRPHFLHPLQLLRPLMQHLPHPVHFPMQAGTQYPAVGVQHLAAGVQHPPAFQHPHVRPLMPQPAMYLKQAEAAIQKPHSEAWEQYLKILSLQTVNQARFVNSLRPSTLPPVPLPLPVCCKADPTGPKQTRKYAIPKYAIGFVIGHNGTRIQATRDVSGATVLLLGDRDGQHGVIGVHGSQGQIHDAVYLMKQNITRYSDMFIGDIDGMLKSMD